MDAVGGLDLQGDEVAQVTMTFAPVILGMRATPVVKAGCGDDGAGVANHLGRQGDPGLGVTLKSAGAVTPGFSIPRVRATQMR